MSTCASGLEPEAEDQGRSAGTGGSNFIMRSKYAQKLQDLLYQQTLQNSDFCDVTLHIDNSVMKAHWCVLVMCPYFQALYDSGMKESVSGELNLNFGAPYAMKNAIKFLYTGEVHVSMERVQDLLEVADYLQISEMTEICARYLKGVNTTLENCVQIMLLSSQHNLETYEAAFRFVCGHLPELMGGAELLNITKNSLLSLVIDVKLSYVNRLDFFNFIVRWTEHDKTERKKDFEELFCSLDLHFVPPSIFADKIEKHPLVTESQKCQMFCLEAKLKGLVGSAPCCPHMTDVIILGGGMHKDCRYRFLISPRNLNSSLYAYFIREERWAKMPDMPYGISKPLMALTEHGQLLVIDSAVKEELDKTKQLLRYCPRENVWTSIKMSYPEDEFEFTFHSFLACGSRLFLVASSKHRQVVSAAKVTRNRNADTAPISPPAAQVVYRVHLSELNQETGDLTIKRHFCQRSNGSEIRAECQQAYNKTTVNDNIIYVLGSKCFGLKAKSSYKKSTKMFVYDVQTNKTKEIYPMKVFEPLTFGLTDGFLTTKLGKQNKKFFNQQQRKMTFDRDFTIKLPPTDAGKEDFSSISINDEVYIFGGRMSSTQEPSTSAAKFSFRTQTWTELDPLPSALIGAGITRGRMPVDVLRCHLECLHCSFFPMKDRTTYNVIHGTHEREDDNLGHYYDMDDSDGSDDYDYYDYDDYDPSYSDDGWIIEPDDFDLYDLF